MYLLDTLTLNKNLRSSSAVPSYTCVPASLVKPTTYTVSGSTISTYYIASPSGSANASVTSVRSSSAANATTYYSSSAAPSTYYSSSAPSSTYVPSSSSASRETTFYSSSAAPATTAYSSSAAEVTTAGGSSSTYDRRAVSSSFTNETEPSASSVVVYVNGTSTYAQPTVVSTSLAGGATTISVIPTATDSGLVCVEVPADPASLGVVADKDDDKNGAVGAFKGVGTFGVAAAVAVVAFAAL